MPTKEGLREYHGTFNVWCGKKSTNKTYNNIEQGDMGRRDGSGKMDRIGSVEAS